MQSPVEARAATTSAIPIRIWGLDPKLETAIFHLFTLLSWPFQIAAAILGSLNTSESGSFIATITLFFLLHWAAWLQTTVAMARQAALFSTNRTVDKGSLLLTLGIRLNRLMFVRTHTVQLEALLSNLSVANSVYCIRCTCPGRSQKDYKRRLCLLAHICTAVHTQYCVFCSECAICDYSPSKGPWG